MTGRAPVLLVPGLWAGDYTMLPLARTLRRRGHPIVAAHIGINIGCTTELVDRLEQRLRASQATCGRPAVVVGWSRGGTLGKLVTMRRPDLVSALVSLGGPNADPMAVSRMVRMQIGMLSRLNAWGVRRVLGTDCLQGECAEAVRALLGAPFPAHIPYVSVYSKRDRVVDWQACCDPPAELVEVDASHFQLGTGARVLRIVAERVDGFEHQEVPQAS
ncbi:MAG: alpha/beta fold hydrolase [Candidatus Dormibacteraeota bacterium]|nr:alpha/beta fold hydrolase [Candidatus Dormibacteraeota bacterium]MBV9525049.1 alpha/beta fold hydrolase [Candidatus Dormibacteraeota bacterium]